MSGKFKESFKNKNKYDYNYKPPNYDFTDKQKQMKGKWQEFEDMTERHTKQFKQKMNDYT